MPVEVRPADASDEAALAAIERETWDPHVTPSVYRERPFFDTSRPDQVLVATMDGRVVGVLAVNAVARALYESAGYRVEGVLVGEYRLPVGPGGSVVRVDDVLMARAVGAVDAVGTPSGR